MRGCAAWAVSGLILAACWQVGAAAAERPLSFPDALEMLGERNEWLAAERSVLGQAEAQLGEARGRRWPELGLSAAYVRLDEPVRIDLAPVRGILQQIDPSLPVGLLPNDIEVQKREFTTASATLRWPLFTGGRVGAGIHAAEAAVAAGLAGLEGTRGSLSLTLVERYFAQVLAEHAHRVKAATVDTLSDHLDRAQRLEAHGQIARAEVLRAQVALSEAKVELASARHSLELARAGLSALLASDERFVAVTTMPEPPLLPALAPMLAEAVSGNPSLRAAREQRLRAEAGVRAARGEQLPTLALFGQHELYKRDLDLFSSEWIIGLALSWSLFDGGVHRSRSSAAQLKADEVGYRLASGQRDVELLIRQRHNALADALGRLEAFATMRELVDESLRAQRRAFEEGLASPLDVVDAELSLQRVELGTLAARYESLLAASGLYEATGQSGRIAELFEDGGVHVER